MKEKIEMVLDSDNKAFMDFCRWLYDENCYERWQHGQKPYERFRVYYSKHTNWLRKEYEQRNKIT